MSRVSDKHQTHETPPLLHLKIAMKGHHGVVNEAQPGNSRDTEETHQSESQGTAPQSPLDPEQLRQFEQFQQFQNFLRYAQAQQQSVQQDSSGNAITPVQPPSGQFQTGQSQLGQSQAEQQIAPYGQNWPAQPNNALPVPVSQAAPVVQGPQQFNPAQQNWA